MTTPLTLPGMAYSHTALCSRALKWLRGSQGCGVAVSEVVSTAWEVPDAIGWRDMGSTSILVECKVSRADFLKDKHKIVRRVPDKGMGNYRYYLTPPGLIDPDELPDGWGLLEVKPRTIRTIKKAKNMAASRRQEQCLFYSLCRRVEILHGMDNVLAHYREASQ